MVMRLDQYLVQTYQFTRNKAQQLIDTDLVLVNAKICNKYSYTIKENDTVIIQSDRRVWWVSRSAEKLAWFLDSYNPSIDIKEKKCLDIGSSTGGFTQVLLQYWANHVDAVDVGTNQLNEILKTDTRVSSYEQIDIRDFVLQFPGIYDVIVCDASFISLVDIIDSIILSSSFCTDIILLYKPQFEVGRENLKHTGIPKNESIVLAKMTEFENVLNEKNMRIIKKIASSLKGEAGNQEWIYYIKKMDTTHVNLN